MKRKTVFLLLKTFLIALAGGGIASFLHVPIPWLLGSMFAVLIGASIFKLELYWPRRMRDIGTIVVGYTIGLSFTKEALAFVGMQLPMIILMTVVMIAFCFVLAKAVSKLSGIDYPTALIGSIPGGLTQMILLAEETKGINVSVVTFLQITRLLMVIFLVPLIVFSPFIGAEATGVPAVIVHSAEIGLGDIFPEAFVFIPAMIFSSWLAGKIRFPTPYLVGPIFATAIIGLVGYGGPPLPSSVLQTSQIILGAYLGLLIRIEKIENKGRITVLAVLSGLLMVLGSWALSMILIKVKPISSATGILSLAPGGMDQLGIIAAEIHADLSVVAGYQLFRLFFIFFVVPIALKAFIRFLRARKEAERMGSRRLG